MKPGVFGPRVGEILQKPTANYVQIDNAGRFMAKLSQEFVEGLPRLFQNPIAQIREMLQGIDLKEFESISEHATSAGPGPQLPSAPEALAAEQKSILKRLLAAEQFFTDGGFAAKSTDSLTEARHPELSSKSGDLMSSARAALALSDYALSIDFLNQAISAGDLGPKETSEALQGRALALYFLGKQERAIEDWSTLIELPGASLEQVAKALNNRGYTRGQQGDWEKEIGDYTRVIEQLPGAPVQQVAKALYLRGYTWGQQGDREKEIADYTRVIEQLPGAPVEQVAKALANRAWQHYKNKSFSLFLRDTEAALEKDPDLDYAAINLGLALLACGRDEAAFTAYRRAAAKFPESAGSLALPDLAEAENRWLSKERASSAREVLRCLISGDFNEVQDSQNGVMASFIDDERGSRTSATTSGL